MLPDRACLGTLCSVGTWQGRWKTLVHLWQPSSSPPVWQTAHKTSSDSCRGSWCCTTCEWMGLALALLLFWSCRPLRGTVCPSSWILTWGWSPVLSGRLALWLASAWKPTQREIRSNVYYINYILTILVIQTVFLFNVIRLNYNTSSYLDAYCLLT